jgi:hypothetical protein
MNTWFCPTLTSGREDAGAQVADDPDLLHHLGERQASRHRGGVEIDPFLVRRVRQHLRRSDAIDYRSSPVGRPDVHSEDRRGRRLWLRSAAKWHVYRIRGSAERTTARPGDSRRFASAGKWSPGRVTSTASQRCRPRASVDASSAPTACRVQDWRGIAADRYAVTVRRDSVYRLHVRTPCWQASKDAATSDTVTVSGGDDSVSRVTLTFPPAGCGGR